jgi:hypothetical protein
MNPESMIQRILAPLYLAKGWIKFVGVMAIIQGVFSIFTLWGILICWLPIWMGALLCGASNQIRIACESDNEPAAQTAMQKLGTYFRIMGVLSILTVIVFFVAMFAAILIPAIVRAREVAGQL